MFEEWKTIRCGNSDQLTVSKSCVECLFGRVDGRIVSRLGEVVNTLDFHSSIHEFESRRRDQNIAPLAYKHS